MTRDITDRLATVGARLKDERVAQKLSRPELAKRSGVPYSTIAEIENEEQKSSTRLHDLAKAFPKKLRIEWLADGAGPRHAAAVQDGSAAYSPSVYFQLLQSDMDGLDSEVRRDVLALIKAIREAVKRSGGTARDLKPASKSRRN